MNKTIRNILAMVLVITLSSTAEASIFATVGMKGLSFANPEAAQAVQTILSISNPAAFVQGYVVGQISGEIIGEIAKQSPEAAQAIRQYNQIEGWVKEGAQIIEEVKIDDKGRMAGGKIGLGETQQDLSYIIDPKAQRGSIKASNIEVSTPEENQDVTFTAKQGGMLEVYGKKYENLGENSKIVLDREKKEVKEADLTLTKATTLELGGRKIQAEKGMRIVYKEGVVDIYGEGQTVTVDTQKIGINSENVKLDKEKITGKDFTLGEKRFTSTKTGEFAEVTVKDEGYLLGKNTQAETSDMIIKSEKGNTMLSRGCQDVSSFANYINPCGKNLIMEGSGFEAQLKEGKNFGIEVEKNEMLKYKMDGGKVALNNGEQTISPKKGNVVITNGGVTTRYAELNGITHMLIDADSVGQTPDVDVTTKLGELACREDSKTGTEEFYYCGTQTTGAAVTGAASLWEKCKSAAGMGAKEANQVVDTRPEWQIEENIKGILIDQGKVEETILADGKKGYKTTITIRDSKGDLHQYTFKSDGSIYKWENVKWKELDLVMREEGLEQLGLIPPKATTPAPPEQKKKSVAEAYQDAGERLWTSLRDEGIRKGKFTENEYFLPGGYKGEGATYLQPTPDRGAAKTIRNSEFMVEPVKDRSGKIIKYIGVGTSQEFIPAGSGKVIYIKKR